MYRLLALDIDGTLVNQHDEISSSTHAALRRAMACGIEVVLATGRRYSKTLPIALPLGLEVPLITASGGLVKDPSNHRTLYCARFDQKTLITALATIDELGFDPVVCADTFHLGFDFYMPRLDARHVEMNEYLAVNAGAGRLLADMVANPPSDVFTGFAMGTRQEMLELAEELERRLPGALYVHVLKSPKYSGYLCEWTPAGATKWSAIQRLAQQWNIADREICAVGDDVNDIPMILAAGLGVAMGNAQPEVKAAADRVAPSLDEDGLATVVDWLLPDGQANTLEETRCLRRVEKDTP